MGSNGFNMVIKQAGPSLYAIFVAASNGQARQIALIEMPHDQQIGDDLKAMDEVALILKKRIRHSLV